jgi:hypothetical protein
VYLEKGLEAALTDQNSVGPTLPRGVELWNEPVGPGGLGVSAELA